MKTTSNRLLRLVNLLLTIAWYVNFALIAFVVVLLTIVFVVKDEHEYDLKVKYYNPPQSEVLQPVVSPIKEAVAQPDQYILKMKAENTPPLIILALSFFALFEALLMTTIHQLRKLFRSLTHETPFSMVNINRLKLIALCFALYLPVDAMQALVNWLSLRQTGFSDRFMIVADLNFTWLAIAAVIFIMAGVFQYGFELQQENKEFV